MANDGSVAEDTLFERSADERVPLIETKATAVRAALVLRSRRRIHGRNCIMPASTEQPLPRGSHPYTVRANPRGMLPELLDQIPPDKNIAVTANGAYDTRKTMMPLP